MKVINVRARALEYSHNIVNIMRPGPLGNPYVMRSEAERDRVVDQFEHLVRTSPQLLERIRALPADALLECCCAPKRCHGDVIAKIWREIHGESRA